MIHPHELAAPPVKALVMRLIEDKIWDKYLLGYTWLDLNFVQLSPDVIEDLKARYKSVEILGLNNTVKTLHVEW